ncbi:hypothetical protein ACI2LF_43765 [Kribbella sp. NPDC020789]
MQREVWTIREVANLAGRSASNAARWANLGLLPGYVDPQGQSTATRQGAKVPADLAAAYATLLRFQVCSTELAELMRTAPAEVLEIAGALTTLANAGQELESSKGRAA